MFLPLFLSVGLDAAGVRTPPPGTHRYEAFMSAKSVGKSTVTLARTDTGTKVDERSEAHLPTGDSTSDSTMNLDGALSPTAYKASYTVQDSKMDVVVTFGNREATMTEGTDVKTFPLGGSSKSFVVFDTTMASGFFLLPAQMRVLADADTTALVPGTGVATFLNPIPDNKPLRPAEVPAGDASLSIAGELPFVEWYDPQTLLVDEVQIPGQGLVVKRLR